MAEKVISKRVIFRSGKQKLFINQIKNNLKITDEKLARLLKISVRTLTDWKHEKFLMPFNSVKFLSKKAKFKIPVKIKIVDNFWYVHKGAVKGGMAVYKKYGRIGGDPDYRKKKWYEWWEKEGKFKPSSIHNTPLSFQKPIISESLAEFVGIMLGDGGMSKYQIHITLHCKDDKDYMNFVVKLVKKLFGINPAIYYDSKDSVNVLVISRINLVNFLSQKIGLKIGNKIKQKMDIPAWIKRNKKFQIACLRGLIDTDGCLVIHKYKVNGKQYCYKKLNFCSASKSLVISIIQILKTFDFKPRLSHNSRNAWIDNQKEVMRYLKVIGSNNPKHIKRWRRRIVV